jgi:hypothetical protein
MAYILRNGKKHGQTFGLAGGIKMPLINFLNIKKNCHGMEYFAPEI